MLIDCACEIYLQTLRMKGGALYGNSGKCYSLLNWKLKRENAFGGSALHKELFGRLAAV